MVFFNNHQIGFLINFFRSHVINIKLFFPWMLSRLSNNKLIKINYTLVIIILNVIFLFFKFYYYLRLIIFLNYSKQTNQLLYSDPPWCSLCLCLYSHTSLNTFIIYTWQTTQWWISTFKFVLYPKANPDLGYKMNLNGEVHPNNV